MKLRMIKRLTAALLCVAMLAGIPALAVFEDDALPAIPAAPEVDAVVELPEGAEEPSLISEGFEVQAQPMSAAVIDVTVPTTLSIHMDANGDITCEDIVITNNGTESVVIAEAQVIALNGWTLVDYTTTTFTDANKGQHKVALQLRSLDSSIAANGGQTTIDVSAKIPYQGAQSTQADIAQVVFVLGVQIPDASLDWEYTTDDTAKTITLTKYIGESNDVVVHNKYAAGGKVYDTVMGESTHYSGPFAGSSKRTFLTSILFEDGVKLPDNCGNMFKECTGLTSLDVSKLDTSKVLYMNGMFNYCRSLTSLDVSNFNTSNVTNMAYMFYDCRSLTSLDVTKFDTSNVTYMNQMFYNCSSLSSLDVSKFNTSNVTGMIQMFDSCSSLTSLDISKFDASKVTEMSDMFHYCYRLSEVTLGSNFTFNGSGTSRKTNLPTPSSSYVDGADGYWYTADGTRYAPNEIPNNVAATYYAVKPAPCDHAYGLWDNSNYPYWTRTCSKCGSVQTVEAPSGLCELRFQLETDSGTVSLGSDYYPISFSEMGWRDFYGIDISKFFNLALSEYNTTVTGWKQYGNNPINNNISDPTNASLFISYEDSNDDRTEYATIVLVGNPVTTVPEASTDWEYTTSGNIITLTKYIGSDTNVVMHNKYKADGKTYENVTFVEPPQVTDPPSARPFTNTVDGEGITSVTIEKGVKAPSSLRYGLNHHPDLAYADLSGLDVSNVTTTRCMFIYNPALANLNLSGWDTSNVTDMGEMFSGCSSLTSLDVSGWDTSRATDMGYMFNGCSSLASLDLSSWDLSRLTGARYMFSNCTNLKTIYVKDSTAYNKLYSLSNVGIPSGCSVIVGPPTSTASLDEPSYYAMASVDVEADLGPPPAPEPAQYTLTISGPSTVDAGYTTSLDITRTPEDDAAINWTSSDETIAMVDEFGVVTGIGAGEVTISAQVGETVCQWIMTVTDIPDVEANLEYRSEGDTPILARYTKEPPLAYSSPPITIATSKSNTRRGTFV